MDSMDDFASDLSELLFQYAKKYPDICTVDFLVGAIAGLCRICVKRGYDLAVLHMLIDWVIAQEKE